MTADRTLIRRKLQERTQEYALTWWPVYVLLIPVLAALALYWNHAGEENAEIILLFASIVVGMEIVLIAVKHLKAKVESSIAHSQSSEEAGSRLLQATLTSPDFGGIRDLLDMMFAIQSSENPLMKRLAIDQISDLAAFLENFKKKKALPFVRGSELITIERHYTSFMHAMGHGGEYVAITLPNFWIEGEDDILHAFFYSQAESASSGIRIRRVFLVTEADAKNPRVCSLLRKHSQISRKYPNGGSITTMVLITGSIDPKEDDFGIYLLNDKPAAIAIARFSTHPLQLQGNDVWFESAIMERKFNLFEDRFANAVPVDKYLQATFEDGDSVLVGKISPVLPESPSKWTS
jgi:hypothetical protein